LIAVKLVIMNLLTVEKNAGFLAGGQMRKELMAEKANIIDVLNGISQVMANAHDGATDSEGKPLETGLRRDKEYDINDRRLLDGFRVQFHGKNVILKYHAEVKLSEVRDNKFESNLESTIAEVASFLKKEYKKLTGKALTLKKVGDFSSRVEIASRHRAWVTAQCDYDLGLDGLVNPESKSEKVDKKITDFLSKGRKENPHKSE